MRRVAASVFAALLLTTFAVAAGPQPAHASTSEHHPDALTSKQAHRIFEATKEFRNVGRAVAEGYLPTDKCSELPGVGGMGYHFANPDYMTDGVIDPLKPEVMLYERRANGELRLVAVEYVAIDDDQDLSTDYDRPYLHGVPFEGPMPGHEPGMPIHYDRHVWLFKHNPDGLLATWNPGVTCPVTDDPEHQYAGIVYDGDPKHVVDGHIGYIRDDDPLHQLHNQAHNY